MAKKDFETLLPVQIHRSVSSETISLKSQFNLGHKSPQQIRTLRKIVQFELEMTLTLCNINFDLVNWYKWNNSF